MTDFHVNPEYPIVMSVIGQVSFAYGPNVNVGKVPVFHYINAYTNHVTMTSERI